MFKRVSLIFILFLLLYTPLYGKELRVVLDRDYPPFTYIDEHGNFVGISVDFWKIWEERTGIKVKLMPVEWAKAHEMIKNKEADIIDNIFKTEEREKYLDFTKPLFKMTSSIYYDSRLPPISSLDDITPYVVGVKENDALIKISLSKNPNIRFKLYKNYSDIVESAKKGEISVFLMDDIPANFYLIKYDLLYKFSKSKPFTSNYLYLATQDGNTEVLNILNENLSQIKDEELEKLAEKYIVKEEEYPEWLGKIILYILLSAFSIILILFIFNRILAKRVLKATEELRETHKELEKASERIWRTYELISDLTNIKLKEEDFLKRILDFCVATFPKADSGIIFLKREDELEVLKSYGIKEELEGKIIKLKILKILDNIKILHKEDLSLIFQDFQNFYKNIKESLILPLKFSEYLVFINIHDENKEKFTEIDIKLMEWFENILLEFHELRDYLRKEEIFLNRIILTLVKTLEYYDKYTQGHSERVAKYAVKIAEKLNLPVETIRKIYWSALVHDIGKIYVPQRILNKPEVLTKGEYELIKIHPVKSEELLKGIEEFKDIAHIVRHHHERWDGKGYPDGLMGEEIPLESRILCIADSFDAMTSERPYKKALNLREAIEEIKGCSGTQFDPKLSEVMIDIIMEEILAKV
ncbi:MAG: transporter substrate-binding domain-containing protein [Dictyoglomus sp.]|nr:transporter substrate-binding domain-containing protein [Dictyoglomus sp.]MDW8189105.1 transporter substrate-binding domain-containing protein [Dictyoglomus sp.]